MFRVTIQIADDRRQMADDGSSETADPYNETRPYTQGDNSNVILSEAKNLNYALQITNSEFYISVQNNPSRLQ